MQSDLLDILLSNRGVKSPEEKARFIKPEYERDMHDPFLMNDMGKAVLRVFNAINDNEKIVVYADYDCDGIPGAVILHDLLKKTGYENFIVYIPDRHEEGYGLNRDAIESFIKDDVKLIVTIDLGTTDHEDIAYAEKKGINVIVTDHHLPHATLPQAYALVNPKIGDTYPEKMLCGAGVMFKFVQAFLKKYGEHFGVAVGWEKWLLDMAGIATLSDMVPLTGENRVIARFGMQVLRKSPRPGLQQLLRKLKIDQRYLVEEDITFMIAPRLNAASRMDSPMRAFELLSEKDTLKAGMLAEHLTKINDERKSLVAQIMKEVKHKLSERDLGPVIVVGNPSWRVGVLGLVAGKICDEYDRPVFVWGRPSGDITIVKGSCRSNGSVNVVTLMEHAKEHFLDFGGHELAGGFSASNDSVHFLEEKLTTSFVEVGQENVVNKTDIIDAVLSLSDVNEATHSTVSTLAPFGLGNAKPTFSFLDVVVKKAKQFGKEKNHLELILSDHTNIEKTAIAFFSDDKTFSKQIEEGDSVHLKGTLEKSYFAGRTTLRLRISDIE
ncbi:MAG: single-stranded-DNA-specific exonuclease RecJ [Candidatus Pacebacteria bacterium]|nr:single-stranded-DNA-specific exonuclease RecJ [Candidatus Paceibacterota bacterium]